MATKKRTERRTVDKGEPLTADGWPAFMASVPDPSTWGTAGPPGTALWHLWRFQADDGQSGVLILDATGKHPDVLLDVQGLPPPAEGGVELHWPRRTPEGAPDLRLIFRRGRAYVRGSLVCGELAWLGGDQVQPRIIDSPLARPNSDDLAQADRALRLLLDWAKRPGGKRDGDGATWPGGKPDFLDDLWATLEKLTRESGTPYGHDPSSRLFRTKMREHPGERTIRDWLRGAELRPRDIKSGAVNRANYPQFVAK